MACFPTPADGSRSTKIQAKLVGSSGLQGQCIFSERFGLAIRQPSTQRFEKAALHNTYLNKWRNGARWFVAHQALLIIHYLFLLSLKHADRRPNTCLTTVSGASHVHFAVKKYGVPLLFDRVFFFDGAHFFKKHAIQTPPASRPRRRLVAMIPIVRNRTITSVTTVALRRIHSTISFEVTGLGAGGGDGLQKSAGGSSKSQ